jgi:hypothetical protein
MGGVQLPPGRNSQHELEHLNAHHEPTGRWMLEYHLLGGKAGYHPEPTFNDLGASSFRYEVVGRDGGEHKGQGGIRRQDRVYESK